jgi:N4-gp56 family major capsid protein
MANFAWSSANTLTQWAKGYMAEWIRQNQFKPYMGKDENKIIQVNRELEKKKGDSITFRFLRKLGGAGVTGDNTLEGNEVVRSNYGHKITIDQLRQAVVCGEMESQKSDIDILKASTPALMDWDMEKFRTEILDALGSANVDGSTKYASCSEANKDAWLTANDGTCKRVLFGAALSNQSAVDHSASLLNVDSTTDILSPGIIDLAKRLAKLASPAIRPIRVNGAGEFLVAFVGSYAMRDLREHATMTGALQYAQARGKNNPMFTDGDLMWSNVLVHEIPELTAISTVGAGTPAIDVSPCYLCGAQALGVAIGADPHRIHDAFDYGNIKGEGVAVIRGVDKLMDNEIQHGSLTFYVSGVADT